MRVPFLYRTKAPAPLIATDMRGSGVVRTTPMMHLTAAVNPKVPVPGRGF